MNEPGQQRLTRDEPGHAPAPGVIPTGFSTLDAALGGGLPRGGIVEMYGPSGCGKTSLALECVAHLQRNGLTAVWIDADRTFDPGYAATLGVDARTTIVVVPDTAEQALEMARTLAASHALDLLVIDSAAALVPSAELQVGIGESGPSLQSRVLASGLRKLAFAARRSGAAILFLNQTRGRADITGEEETTAGGPPLKLQAAARISLRAGVGLRMGFRMIKNRPGESFAEGELDRAGVRERAQRP